MIRITCQNTFNNQEGTEMTYKPAFPGGTSTWRELDKAVDDIAVVIDDYMYGMTDQEYEYILKQLSDYVDNWLWDLTPQSYKDRVAGLV